jgi:adenylate cyclase class IV
MGSERCELTYKQRKRNGDITDRTEINLRLTPEVGADDVVAFVTAMGLTEHFSLRKESHIFHVKDGDAHTVLALYDVMGPDGIKRFLEVEIENTSEIEDQVAAGLLGMWVHELQETLGLGTPLNTSLYELYAPRDALFVPESF